MVLLARVRIRRGEPLQQPGGDPAQRLLAVGVGAVLKGQDRNRHALVAAGQERDLVVDPAGAGAQTALEVQPPARGLDACDPPALRGVIVFTAAWRRRGGAARRARRSGAGTP